LSLPDVRARFRGLGAAAHGAAVSGVPRRRSGAPVVDLCRELGGGPAAGSKRLAAAAGSRSARSARRGGGVPKTARPLEVLEVLGVQEVLEVLGVLGVLGVTSTYSRCRTTNP